MDLTFPIEFIVLGRPVSLQAKRARSKEIWKAKVRAASVGVLPDGHFATERPLAVTLYHFAAEARTGDVDNIVKLVLDALIGHIYLNDGQVERVVAQKFDRDNIFPFSAPSLILAAALDAQRPVLYVRLSDQPFEELA